MQRASTARPQGLRIKCITVVPVVPNFFFRSVRGRNSGLRVIYVTIKQSYNRGCAIA